MKLRKVTLNAVQLLQYRNIFGSQYIDQLLTKSFMSRLSRCKNRKRMMATKWKGVYQTGYWYWGGCET